LWRVESRCNDIRIQDELQDDADFAVFHNSELPPKFTSTIRSRLSDAERNLTTLEYEIAHVESILDGIRSQRTQTITSIQSYREALAPHRKLPNEILGEIFVCATPMIMLPPKEYCREAPWNITHVCSKWRNVAFATPAVWDNISIMHDAPNSIYRKSTPSPVRSALLRSGHSFIVLNIRRAAPTFLGYAAGPCRVSSSVSTVIIPRKDQPNEASATFSLYWDHVYQRTQDSTIVSAITHVGSLTLLRINIPVPASDIEVIIGYAPCLDTLHLPNGHPFAISTLAKMSCGNLLPKLKNLSCMLNTETQDAYFDMLESRRVFACTDISTVYFYVFSEGLNRNVGREENLRDQGWRITFHTSS
jgi:F-box-like